MRRRDKPSRESRPPIPREVVQPRRSQWPSERAYVEALDRAYREYSAPLDGEPEAALVVTDYAEAMAKAEAEAAKREGQPRPAGEVLAALHRHVALGHRPVWIE